MRLEDRILRDSRPEAVSNLEGIINRTASSVKDETLSVIIPFHSDELAFDCRWQPQMTQLPQKGESCVVFETDGDLWVAGWSPKDPLEAPETHAASNVQVFSTVGAATWTKPAGCSVVTVTCIGGGAGGRGNRGGGGGGGLIRTASVQASVLPSTVPVTVGAGGVGSTGNTVTAGASSSFGGVLVATGGAVATTSSSAAQDPSAAGVGGPGGFTATAGTTGSTSPISGIAGGPAMTVGSSAPAGAAIPGGGGGGGNGVSAGGSSTGGHGGLYGGGGGGGGDSNGKGGDGAQGIVVVIAF